LDGVLEAQKEQIARFGGAEGIRDLGMIESALARPQQLYYYDGQSDILALAIRLGVAIAQNHGFVDGNKRTGAVAMLEFMVRNGYLLQMPNDTTLGALFEAAVIGKMSEEQLAEDLYPYVMPL
jgi:death on curing protein